MKLVFTPRMFVGDGMPLELERQGNPSAVPELGKVDHPPPILSLKERWIRDKEISNLVGKLFYRVWQFLSHAVGQPRIILKADCCNFSLIIFDECQFAGADFYEEINFRFGISLERAWNDVLAPHLPEQLLFFPPER